MKSNFGLAAKDTRASSSQVVRKSTVQATFKELYEFEQERLLFNLRSKDHVTTSQVPRMQGWEDVKLKSVDPDQAWVIDPMALKRGSLFELEVRLAADNVYKFSHMFSTMAEIITAEPQLFPGVADSEFEHAVSINGVIARLMAGLIPLRAEATQYCVARKNGQEFAVNTELLSEPAFQDCEIVKFAIVGVSETKSYWQDTRRILFSDLTFRVLGRLTESGFRKTWNPIKLTELLKEAVPDLAADISGVAANGLSSLSREHQLQIEAPSEGVRQRGLRVAASSYARLAADSINFAGNVGEMTLRRLDIPPDDRPLSIDELRSIFADVSELIEEAAGSKLDPLVAATLRGEALRDAGLDELGNPVSESTSTELAGPPESHGAVIEAEIVAIYW
jgi:hypothetical protein